MQSLRHNFLIAMPSMKSPAFSETVTYICEHNSQGSMGIVINKPLDVTFAKIFEQVSIKNPLPGASKKAALYGGPVQMDRGFVLHPFSDTWSSSFHVGKLISVTSSKDILQALAEGKGPKEHCLVLGYAGWGAGQLERELLRNDWLTCPADSEILFNMPYQKRWEACAKKIGVDINTISPQPGHA